MNIFVLDIEPEMAAIHQCDKHVIKMVLESAQLLCAPFEPGIAPYRRTHYNHPCAKWLRESMANFDWLVRHAVALVDEYEFRYGRTHKSSAVIQWASDNRALLNIPDVPMTAFAQAMPDIYKNPNDVVSAYRAYYIGEKYKIATWNHGRDQPYWWPY